MSKSNDKHKMLILLGSPRKKGNSSILAREIAAGAESMGAEVESIYIQEKNIKACQACWYCQTPESKGCAIKDDMQEIFPKMIEADSWVIATPIHWFNMSSQTKLWMDRIFALPKYGDDAFNKKIGIALAYGDEDPYSSGAVNAIRCFEDSFKYVGAKISGMVYGTALEKGVMEQNEATLKTAKKLGIKIAK